MSHAYRGRALERRCLRAVAEYRRNRVGWWHHAQPGTAVSHDGKLIHTSKAGVDLFGLVKPGKPSALELKESNTTSLPLANIDEGQARVLELVGELGGEAALIVAFHANREGGETFYLPWVEVRRINWRASISLAFCRAFGELIEDSRKQNGAAHFLSHAPHPLREQARAEVETERTAAQLTMATRAKLAEAEQVPMSVPPPPPKRTHDEVLASLRTSVDIGIRNQMKKRRVWPARR